MNTVIREGCEETLATVLDTFSQLDDMRWCVKGNYNLINYSLVHKFCNTDIDMT